LTQSILPHHGPRTLRAWLICTFALFAAMGMSKSALADTYYVRSDGGSASQCTGRSDAPYPGSGTNQACAWSHPFVALPPGKSPRIAGGDTLIVGPGNYMMGIGAPDTDRCSSSYAYDCFMPPIPSGPSASQPTRILGRGHDGSCAAPPQLWGTQRAYTILNLRGSNNVHIGCFEVTDREACIMGHGAGLSCPSNGKWARTGIIAHDSANVLLRDLNIHGLGYAGVHAGRLRDWTMERVTIRANGWVGWDGDIGSDGRSSNSGNMIFREANISWNGCTENYPGTDIIGCWAQAAGGYGDGLGTHQTGGHWLFEDSIINHNTSDGLDLLYMADGGSVTILRSWFEGNAGNQVKTKGNARIENSVVVGNCAYFHGKFPAMSGNDHCRALGNALSIGLFSNSTVNIVNNTISSQGDCLAVAGGGGQVNFANNAMIGEIDWRNGSRRSCLFYATDGGTRVSFNRDQVDGVRNNACPSGTRCTGDMKIANRSYNGFDPMPLAGSPLVDNASTNAAPGHDYRRYSRNVGQGPDIGAIERGASSAGGGTPPPGGVNALIFRDSFQAF
jgi:hypothetical protein